VADYHWWGAVALASQNAHAFLVTLQLGFEDVLPTLVTLQLGFEDVLPTLVALRRWRKLRCQKLTKTRADIVGSAPNFCTARLSPAFASQPHSITACWLV
jgi:hypothetical protein